MEYGLFNITSATTTTLLAKGLNAGAIKSITICNCNQDEAVKVRLFLDDDTNQTSFIENLNIPGGVTLALDNIGFNNNILGLKLQTQGTGVDVNVMLK